MFKVFQVSLEKDDIDTINAHGFDDACAYSPRIKAYVKCSIKREYQESFSLGQHKHVATVNCETLHDVFDIGNIGPEELMHRHAPMRDVSVGDVIQTPTGEFFAVASIGFEKVNL